MWLIKASLRNPYMVLALVLGILILGVLSAMKIPVDILPVFKAPAVQVLTYYPGMSASAIEKTITNRMERWVSQAPGARSVESRSVPGVSVVKVYFRDDIDPNEALTLVNSLALGALPNLPPNTLPPVALPFDATGTLPVGILTVANPFLDDARQKDIARIEVRNMLGAVNGCIAPVVVGGRDRTVMIYLDPQRMEARKLVPMDVVAALKKGNLMVSPGTAYFGPNQMLLDNNAMVNRVEDLNSLPLTFGSAQTILLRDIGRAEDAATIQTSRVRLNDANEVFVPIYRQRGASSLGVVEELKKIIPSMEQSLPKGTILRLVMDQTVAVRKALGALTLEGAIGMALVCLMILLFLGDWRMTVIATLSMPLSLCGALIGLFATGNTINLMTLSGLALAIGPLVDDAIVELENNHRNHQLGKSRLRAAMDGCGEVLIPVLVATCTTVLVLAPLAFMTGMSGFLFRPLTLAVGFAMLTSFLLSRTFVPMMCAKFLPEAHAPKPGRVAAFSRFSSRFQSLIDILAVRYARGLDRCLENKALLLVGVLLLFAGSLLLLPRIGRDFFPQVDAAQITLRLRAPSNLRLDAAEERVKTVEQFLRKNIPASDREMIVSEMGLNPDWSAAYTTNSGQQDAIIRVQLTPSRARSAQDYAVLLRKAFQDEPAFADLRVDFDTGGMVSTALNQGNSSPIDIQIQGGTTQELLSVARQVRALVAAIPGTADVRIQQRDDAPYLVLDVDRVKSARQGLSTEDVVLQVVVALNSSVSVDRNFWIDSQSGNQYFVGVQFPEDVDRRLEDVLNMPVSANGRPTQLNLGTLVTPRRSNGEVEINHVGLKRVANIFVNTEGRDLASLAVEIEKAISGVQLPEGLKIVLQGEYGRMNDAFAQIAAGISLAVVLVYLLQVTLFRSWIAPGVIMISVPLGFIGVIWMLFLTGTTLNVQSLIGATFLVGIAVNNGVLLVDFANRRRRESGLAAKEAMREEDITRFRPINMTFLATLLAMAPMAIGLGRGAEAATPLARAIVGGLLSSTFLTLFLVPVLYVLLVRRAPTEAPDLENV
jgi:multidrug efflux pump subunit AcrB